MCVIVVGIRQKACVSLERSTVLHKLKSRKAPDVVVPLFFPRPMPIAMSVPILWIAGEEGWYPSLTVGCHYFL